MRRQARRPSARDVVASTVHGAVAATLTKHGIRYTQHRRALVSAMRAAGQPLTIPQIVAAVSTLPQSSVYRNLAIFDEVGVVHRMTGTGDFALYELAEDLVGHHHHMVCSSCGDVTDVTLPEDAEKELERTLRRVARRHGFSLAGHRLDLVGDCVRCDQA